MKTVLIRAFVVAIMLSTSIGLYPNTSVIISEIMPCNISTYRNSEKEYSGWVEFYNDGKEKVNIKGWTLIHHCKKSKKSTIPPEPKWTWVIDFDIVIPAGEYKVVPIDNYVPLPHTSAKEKHIPYKLDVDGGSLELVPPSSDNNNSMEGNILNYTAQKPHISYGYDGEDESTDGYMIPSKGEKNNKAYEDLKQCARPTFTETQPGVDFKDNWSSRKVRLGCETSGATIYYTLDGSIPTKSSHRYIKDTTKINFDTTCIVRARAYKDDYLPSDILTGSFIIYPSERNDCEGVNPPVVSIVTDREFLYNKEYGIHCTGEAGIPGTKGCIANSANYNQAWQRAANFEYFKGGQQKMSQEAMIGIMGGCSRQYEVKSLKITTSKRTGAELFSYKFFEDEGKKDNQYSSLQLRNGGNGFETLRCRDGFIQYLAKDMGNIDYQAYQPVSYYLNGKYKGLMGLRERTNGSYIEANYGIEEDKLDIVEMSENKIEASEGDLNAYNEMIEFVSDSANYKKSNFVALLSNYMDVDEYTNYMIFEQFVVNTDWPGNNQKCWRKHIGGKFRWILYDTDFALGLYGGWDPNYTNVDLNTVTWCTGEGNEHNWANASSNNGYAVTEESKWKVILFKSLMKNPGFRNLFLTKTLLHLYTTFSEDNINAKKEAFTKLVRKEHCMTKKANMPGNESSTSTIESMAEFAIQRRDKYKTQVANYCGIKDIKKSTLRITCKGDLKDKVIGFLVNDASITKSDAKEIKLLKTMDINIKPILPDGYIVKKWKVDTLESTKYSIDFKLNKDTVDVEFTIQEESYDKPSIVINEICAKSNIFIDPESNEGEDWIELYNTGDEYVDVAGFYLQDRDTTIQIARGYELTNIPPKGHLLLWADGRSKSGAQHLGFKLSSQGERIKLYKNVRDSIIIIDRVEFKSLEADCSYGRKTDGSSTFTTFSVCSENKQFSEATPGEANGIYNCKNVIEMKTYPIELTCDFESMQYRINGERQRENPTTYRILKGKSATISPILPRWCGFVAWELSTYVESTEEFVSNDSEWRYFHKNTAPKGNWKELEYDTTGWKTGHGMMGYDSSNKDRGYEYDTKISYEKGDSAKYITAYFRNEFMIDDTTGLKTVIANVTYDDGVAIYVNGKELDRFNLPSKDSIETLSYSDTTLKYYDDQREEISINTSNLVKGKNIIAAEVHQINSATSDMTFAMTVKAKYRSHICKEETFTITPKEAFSARLIVSGHTDIEDASGEEQKSEITIYPNPTENIVYLHGCKEKSLVTVSNQLGGILLMQYVKGEEDPIDLSRMANGTYIITVTSDSQHAVGKIIKR